MLMENFFVTQTLQQGTIATPGKSNLEMLMENFVATQTRQNEDLSDQNLHTSEVLMQLTTMVESLATHNKALETRISQVTQ